MSEQEDRKRAIFYGQIAREVSAGVGDAMFRALILNSYGVTLVADSQFSTAITVFDEALAVVTFHRD
jgi:fructose-1,6-bisphosphatase